VDGGCFLESFRQPQGGAGGAFDRMRDDVRAVFAGVAVRGGTNSLVGAEGEGQVPRG